MSPSGRLSPGRVGQYSNILKSECSSRDVSAMARKGLSELLNMKKSARLVCKPGPRRCFIGNLMYPVL